MKTLLVLTCALVLSAAQRRRTPHNPEWDYRSDAEKVNTRGCANLTVVLDNWKFAIMTQVKDLLLNDHSTVLPDYGRIPPLSDALSDLYKEFNALKERLLELTNKFEGVEAFVDDVRAGKRPSPPRAEPRPTGDANATPDGEGAARPPGRRNRVVIRKVVKPEGASQA